MLHPQEMSLHQGQCLIPRLPQHHRGVYFQLCHPQILNQGLFWHLIIESAQKIMVFLFMDFHFCLINKTVWKIHLQQGPKKWHQHLIWSNLKFQIFIRRKEVFRQVGIAKRNNNPQEIDIYQLLKVFKREEWLDEINYI